VTNAYSNTFVFYSHLMLTFVLVIMMAMPITSNTVLNVLSFIANNGISLLTLNYVLVETKEAGPVQFQQELLGLHCMVNLYLGMCSTLSSKLVVLNILF
jgi:hypothetical protein